MTQRADVYLKPLILLPIFLMCPSKGRIDHDIYAGNRWVIGTTYQQANKFRWDSHLNV